MTDYLDSERMGDAPFDPIDALPGGRRAARGLRRRRLRHRDGRLASARRRP